MKNRVISFILIIQMLLCLIFSLIPSVFAANDEININSKKDFVKFANNCRLDTWSFGKTVNLNCDIDFKNGDFKTIATFSGVFNGNNHSISGIKFNEKGSYQGLFRYICEDAAVSNLKVKGKFTPGGSKSYIGGIVGHNSGTIENCTFEGTVKGENVVGGIAGYNADVGKILSCVSFGNISGENFTGGIVGKNSGFVNACTNNAAVNTVYEEKESSISDIDMDAGSIVEIYKNKEQENDDGSMLGHTDTGGIVGFTSGIIQGCTNNATIGYKHVGYNVGGIAGRQSGYMLGCVNYGLVSGRKDVGGIVGQAEPYILLNSSEVSLRDLRKELNNLHSMVNKFITDTDNLSDDVEKHLDGISKHAKTAGTNAEEMLNGGEEFIDDNIAEINAQSAILSNTLNKLEPVFDSLENGSKDLETALDMISEAVDNIKIDDGFDELSSSMTNISKALTSLRKSIVRAEQAKNDLCSAIDFANKTKVKKAVSDLSDAVKDIITAKQTIKNSVEKIKKLISSKPESFEDIGVNAGKIADNLKIINDNNTIIINSLETVKKSLDTIILNTEISFSDFQNAAENMEDAIGHLDDSLFYASKGFDELSKCIKNINGDTSDGLKQSKNKLTDGFKQLSYAADDIKIAMGDMKDIISDLSDEKPLEFVKLGEDFKSNGEELFDSLSAISDEIESLRNTLSNEKSNFVGNITSISNQFNLVMNLLIDEFEQLSDGAKKLEDIFLDVSDEDIENTRQGKVADCHNYGEINADRNTGGIVGAMAIEYTKAPEDDIDKPDSLNFTYRTKAILQSCINEGKITGKKDCTGGIAGSMEIGTIYGCENYGDTKSTNGNYVGGIAGKSESSVRKCYAKSKVEGKRYIGGISGKANFVASSYTIVNAIGDENVGAICGEIENINNLYQNFHINNNLGAVDGISYDGKAEPLSFEELKNMNGVPLKFISFTVMFTADDKIVKTQDIKYGEDADRIKYPEIPEKDGYYGVWQTPTSDVITENTELKCEYKPYITVLASKEKNKNNKLSLVLAEGEFDDKAQLKAEKSDKKMPAKSDKNVKVYDITLEKTQIKPNETVTLHIINEDKAKVTAWILNGKKWKKTNVESRGKYVIVKTKGTQNTICLKYTERSFVIVWVVLAFVAAAAVLFVIKFKKRIKK